jgi:hypothetical protein
MYSIYTDTPKSPLFQIVGDKNVVGDKKSTAHGVKAKRIAAKKAAAKEPAGVESRAVVTLDRRALRTDRRSGDRRVHQIPVAVERRIGERRAKVSRRRQIDPTTCERDYSPDEIEFMSAMDDYKRRSGRMFPTCSEVLEVVKSLGYTKQIHIEPVVLPSVDVAVGMVEAPVVAG